MKQILCSELAESRGDPAEAELCWHRCHKQKILCEAAVPAQTEMKPGSTKSCAKDVCALVEFNLYCLLTILGPQTCRYEKIREVNIHEKYMVQNEERLVHLHK